MRSNFTLVIFFLLLLVFFNTGCSRNATQYYDDAENPGIAIFSNTGNNILSCLVNGKPWRTASRITYGIGARTSYEVYITKQSTNTLQDILLISWNGYYPADSLGQGNLNLIIPVAKNFSNKNFAALQGQRLQIDTTNAFFTTSISGLNSGNIKGKGNIYFHIAQLDSIGPSAYMGKMSGLFEADFGAFKITRGRFDHLLNPENVHF
jgi:hypothetical protein